jgi:hypothetical protein
MVTSSLGPPGVVGMGASEPRAVGDKVPMLNLSRVVPTAADVTTARGPVQSGDLARIAALDPLASTFDADGVLVNEQHVREAKLALCSSVSGVRCTLWDD